MSKRLHSASSLAVNRKLPGTFLSQQFSPPKLLTALLLMLFSFASVQGFSQNTISTPVTVFCQDNGVADGNFTLSGSDMTGQVSPAPPIYTWEWSNDGGTTWQATTGAGTPFTGAVNGQNVTISEAQLDAMADAPIPGGQVFMFHRIVGNPTDAANAVSNTVTFTMYKYIPAPATPDANVGVANTLPIVGLWNRYTLDCDDADQCITLNASAAPANWQGTWTYTGLSGGLTATISDIHSPTATFCITGSVTSDDLVTLTWTLSYVGPQTQCVTTATPSNQATLLIQARPDVVLTTPTSATICTGSGSFGIGYIGLTPGAPNAPTNYDLDILSYGGTGASVSAASPIELTNIVLPNNSPINIPFITAPTAPGVITYRIRVSNGCYSLWKEGSVTVVLAPTATAGADQQVCAGSASASLGGNVVAAPLAGTWTVQSGPAAGTFSNSASGTSTFTASTPGDYILRWTVAGTTPTPYPCPAVYDEVKVTVLPQIPATCPISTPAQNAAVASVVSLVANDPAPHTGVWAIISGTGTLTNSSSHNASLTVGAAGPIVVRWTVSPAAGATGCTAQNCEVTITGVAATIAQAGVDKQACLTEPPANNAVVALSPVTDPAAPVGTTYSWAVIGGGPAGSVAPGGPSATPAATFTATAAGVYTLRLTATAPGPVTYTDDVIVTVYAKPTATISSPTTQSICAGKDGAVHVTFTGVPNFAGQLKIEGLDAAMNVTGTATHNFSAVTGTGNITIPAALLPNTGITNKQYRITLVSVSDANAGGCTGIVGTGHTLISVEPVANISATLPTGNVCPGTTIIFPVTNPNAVGGTFNYTVTSTGAVTITPVVVSGAAYSAAFNFGNFGITAANCGITTLTFTFTPVSPGSLNCPGVPQVYTMTVGDVTAPVLTTTGTLNATVDCGDARIANWTNTAVLDDQITGASYSFADNCSAVTVTKTVVTTAGACGGTYTITITYTGTDACGNATSVQQVITVQDNSGPVISANQLPSAQDFTISCENKLATNLLALVPTTTFPYTAADVNLGTLLNTGITISGTWSTTNTWITTAAGSDNCSAVLANVANLVIEQIQPTLDACPNYRRYIIKYQLKDACGNLSPVYTQTITVTDLVAPEVTAVNTVSAPAGATAYAYALTPRPGFTNQYTTKLNVGYGTNCTVKMPDYRGLVTFTDACGAIDTVMQGNVDISNNTGNFIGGNEPGTDVIGYGVVRRVVVRGIDLCGNYTDVIIWDTLIDATAPSAVCITSTEAINALSADAKAARGLKWVDGQWKFVKYAASNNCSASFTAAELEYNSKDNCTPYASLRWGISTSVPSSAAATASSVTVNTGSGTLYLSVRDAIGNWSYCGVPYVVYDTIKPVINCGNDTTLSWDAGCTIPMPDMVKRASFTFLDNCGTANTTYTGVEAINGQLWYRNSSNQLVNSGLTYTQYPAVGSIITQAYPFLDLANPYIPVEITVVDASGNSSTCTVRMNLRDVTAPVITCPGSNTTTNQTYTTANTTVTIATPATSKTINTTRIVGKCGAFVSWVDPNITDNCLGPISPDLSVNNVTVVKTLSTTGARLFTSNSGTTFTIPEGAIPSSGVATTRTQTLATTGGTYTVGATQAGWFPLGTTVVTYTATDRAGNSSTCTITINVTAPEIKLNNIVTNAASCGGDNDKGGIIVTPVGGVGATNISYAVGGVDSDWDADIRNQLGATGGVYYLFRLDGGTWSTVPAASASFGDLAQGSHYIEVKDICQNAVARLDFVISGPSNLAATTTVKAITCNNGTDGGITVNATGGTSPYTYEISSNAGVFPNPAVSQNSNVFSNLNPGTYLIRVRDAGGCIVLTTTTIVNPTIVGGSIAGTTTVGVGATAPVITFTGTGGTAPYTFTYTVNGGAAQTVTGSSTATVTQATGTAGTFVYTLVSVKDSKDCSRTINTTATVTVGAGNPELAISFLLLPAVTHGTTNIEGVVTVANIASTPAIPSSGLITVFVAKDSKLNLTFPASATTVLGQAVSNSVWTFDNSNSSFYRFTTTASVPGNEGVLKFGFTGSIAPGSTNGSFAITATLLAGSGGDINNGNNADSETVTYFMN